MTRSPLRLPSRWPALAPCLALSGCALVAYPEIEGADPEPRDAAPSPVADAGPRLDASLDASLDGGSDLDGGDEFDGAEFDVDSEHLREIPRAPDLLYVINAGCSENPANLDWGPHVTRSLAPKCGVSWLDGHERTLLHVCCEVPDTRVFALAKREERDSVRLRLDDSMWMMVADRADRVDVTWATLVQVNAAGSTYDARFERPPGSTKPFEKADLDVGVPPFVIAATYVKGTLARGDVDEFYKVEWVQELPTRITPGDTLWCAFTQYDFRSTGNVVERRAITDGSKDIYDPSAWTPCRFVQ